MMNFRFALILFSAALLLSAGCSAKPSSLSSLSKVADNFSKRLRWQDFSVASAYVAAAERDAFLGAWQGEKDLRVVASRVDAVKLIDPQTATVSMTIDYYLLPSNTIRQIASQQEWRYREGEGFEIGSWELVSGMPMLPEPADSSQKDE